jgi:cell division protease FtsH
MSEDKGKGRPSQESQSGGSNFLWYMGLIAIGVLLFAFWFTSFNTIKIDYHDLKTLATNSKHTSYYGRLEKGFDGTLEIKRDRPDGKQDHYRLSKLRDVKMGDTSVTGKVDREMLTETGELNQPVTKKFRTEFRPTDETVGELKTMFESNFIVCGVAERSILRDNGPLLLLTVLLVVFFIVMMRRLTSAGSPMSFGRSRGKLYAQEDLGVSFGDVAGIDEAVEEVKEVVDFLSQPEKYQKLGGRIPKGVLLVGPPGTGKTLLAKAIAGEAGVPFFSLSGSDFVEMFVGVGAARVRDMFSQAAAKAPCIIFIDELDALGKTRGNGMVGGHDEREQTLNALLVEMDGFEPNSGVIVMAATNRPETLDPALMRPGRFDRHVLVDRPDILGREAILKVHVKNVKLDETVDLSDIAGITPGFSGADLAHLVNEGALLAARAEKTAVGMVEFNEGVERVTAGLEKKQRVMNADEKNRVAFHEAGHALVAYSLPNTDPVHKVSIIPRGLAALGYTMQRPDGDRFLMTQSELESRIQVLMAGTMAEELIYTDISTGAQNDLERATEIARSMVMEYGMSRMGRVNYRDSNKSPFLVGGGEETNHSHSEQTSREIDEEVRRIIDESLERVRHILDVRRQCLENLTARLIEIEAIDADELKRIIDASIDGPLVVPGTSVGHRLSRPAPGTTSKGTQDAATAEQG